MINFGRAELNISYNCNLKCLNCNRLCDKLKLDEDMTVEQVKLFLQKLQEEKKHLSRIKVVGGEPTQHPDFVAICALLSYAVKSGLIGKVVVNTNGINPPYNLENPFFPGVFWKVSKPSKKAHRPFLWSPKDMGLETFGPCSMPRVCGYSLDSRGWLPCSSAPAIVRVFGLEHLYKPLDGPLPGVIWGMEELCPHCIFSVNEEYIRGKSFITTPQEWKQPTETWERLLKEYMKNNPEKVLK